MNQKVLQQSLSALMDNEADELELHRVLKASDDPEVRAVWTRYNVARAAMHNEAAFASVDLSAQIMAAIDAEPALVTPVSAAVEAVKVHKMSSMPWLGRVAVAASVTLAVLGGVRFYNQDAVQQEALVVQNEQRLPAPAHGSVVLASYSAQGPSATQVAETSAGQDSWYERRLPSYLRQHAQQSSVNKTEVGLPYARAASLEGQ